MLDNDEKWCTFVTKRAKDMTKPERLKIIREQLQNVMNPFSQDLVIQIDVRLSPTTKVHDPVYGDLPASNDLEKQTATKLYKTAEYRDRTMNLSATAQRMMLFIMYEMSGADDWVELEPLWYKEVSGAGSRNMYKKGKEELVRYGYISRTEQKNVYWVNPILIFGGNRITKYPDKVVVKNTFTGKDTPKPKRTNKSTGTLNLKRKKYVPDEEQERSEMESEFLNRNK